MDQTTLGIWLGPIITLIIFAVGVLIGYGKLRAIVVTKDECRDNQMGCSDRTLSEIKDDIQEVKDLVVDLHDKQSIRIEELDKKRHDLNNKYQELFLGVQMQFTETQKEISELIQKNQISFTKLQKQVSEISGYVKAVGKNGGNSI